MRRLLFPINIAIGTDIVHIPRIWRLVSKGNGRNLVRFANRILHPLELDDLSRRHPHWQEFYRKPCVDSQALAQWLGGRFAAKEAARKAMGAAKLGWKDVRVELREGSGQPLIIGLTQDMNEDVEREAKLSISHDGEYAMATVLAVPVQQSAIINQQCFQGLQGT